MGTSQSDGDAKSAAEDRGKSAAVTESEAKRSRSRFETLIAKVNGEAVNIYGYE